MVRWGSLCTYYCLGGNIQTPFFGVLHNWLFPAMLTYCPQNPGGSFSNPVPSLHTVSLLSAPPPPDTLRISGNASPFLCFCESNSSLSHTTEKLQHLLVTSSPNSSTFSRMVNSILLEQLTSTSLWTFTVYFLKGVDKLRSLFKQRKILESWHF